MGEGTTDALVVATWHDTAEVPEAEWGALTARAPASITGSRPWVDAALATVNAGSVPMLIGVLATGRLIGLLSLVADPRAKRPTLRMAGSPCNDLADMLVLPGHGQMARTAVVDRLARLVDEGWAVELEDLDPEGSLVQFGGGGDEIRWRLSSTAPIIDLHDPSARPSARRARQWDRSLHALRAQGRVEVRRRSGDAMLEDFDEFVRVRDARLAALGRNLSDPPADVLAAMVQSLAPLGRCAFMELVVGGRSVARDLYLLDKGVAMLWLRALDMRWLAYSCGHLLLRASMELLMQEGHRTLDLGRGSEPYKFSFGARERELLGARLYRPQLVRPIRGRG